MRAILGAILLSLLGVTPAAAQALPISPWALAGPVMIFPQPGMSSSGVVSAPQGLFPDGTSLLPAVAFASEPTLGFWRSGAGIITEQGALAVTGNLFVTGASSQIYWNSKTTLAAPANGVLNIANYAGTAGSQLKADALPTVASCGAGSPAVTAGSTPLAGSVTIGTTSVVTCTITFNGTAYASAPFCTANVATATAANTRAIGTTTTTTTLVLVPAAAWADSAVVAWQCMSSK